MMITVVTSLRMSIMVLLGRSFRCCLCWLRLWRSCTHPNTTCGSCRDTGLRSDTATLLQLVHTHPPPHMSECSWGAQRQEGARGGGSDGRIKGDVSTLSSIKFSLYPPLIMFPGLVCCHDRTPDINLHIAARMKMHT